MIICVASTSQDHLDDFLENISHMRYDNFQVVVIGTGEELDVGDYRLSIVLKQLSNFPRSYAQVVQEKIIAASPYCNDNSIVFMADVDYSFNPYALKFADIIFSENPKVNYLSLLRGPGVSVGVGPQFEHQAEWLSGFRFWRHHSTLGGAIIARWSAFKKHVVEFFAECGNGGMFDQDFWNFLHLRYFTPYEVYTLVDFSLVQHTLLGSCYNRDNQLETHMRGINFDPRMNPFKWGNK